jgi:cytidylate kinase
MAQKQLSEAEAAEFIRREDTARKRFLKAQFDADIDDPFGYHLILNTDQFNPDQASELIAEAVMTRFPV